MRRLAFALCLFVPSVAHAAESKDYPHKYRQVGPFAGGRVSRACGVPGDPLTYFAATASGGVWKSADGGLTWKPIFDDQPTSSIGSIAVAASDPNVIYVGSGEANIRGNVSPGAGIFKSTDAGKTWTHQWKQLGQIGALAVHPKNADIAYAAVLGHAFGPNPERGVYRTTNGGKTWERILFKNEETGCCDVCLDPNNPRIVYAGFWQTRRRPWELTSGGPGSDLFVSRDGGNTWTSLKDARIPETVKPNGLPTGIWGRVGIAVAPSDSQRIYAVIEADKGGLFRSDNGGESWSKVSDDRHIRQRAWYYSTLTIHPAAPDVLFAPQVQFLKSIDGGKTLDIVKGTHHPDHHDCWIDPKNPNRMIVASDGGVDISTDGGKTWSAPRLPIGQFYHVSADNSVPYRIMGCMQDLGSVSGPSRSLTQGGIGAGDWYSVGGGEAGFAFADPSDPNIVYAGEYGGILTRYNHRTRQTRNITVNQMNPTGIDPAKLKYRFQWTAPILISPHDPKTVYHGGNILFRTRDAGQAWEVVSGDLTRNDKQKQQWSGGPITGDNTGAEVYCTIFALAESPKQKGLLWAGTDDGLVHLSRDEGKTWTNVTANVMGLPDWGTVVCIEPSPFDAGTAYLVVDNHRMDDYRPYVWRTSDFGKTWTKLTDGLYDGVHCKVVREDPKKKGLLYLGTERGVHFSRDAGKTWKPLQLNLPTVPVHDLVVKNDDLVVGTHGRSLWILNDLTTVRETSEAVKEKPVHLFTVRPATRWREAWAGPTEHPHGYAAGDNPRLGTTIWFHLAKEPKGEGKLEILDSAGTVIATASSKVKKSDEKPDSESDDEERERGAKKSERKLEAKAGLNRFVWDLTHDGAEPIPGSPADSGNVAQGIPVAPGAYTVRLTIGGQTQTQNIMVAADPRWIGQQPNRKAEAVKLLDLSKYPDKYRPAIKEYFDRLVDEELTAPLAEQEKLALRVRNEINKLTATVKQIRAVKKQIDLRKELLKDNDAAKDLLKQSEAFDKKLDDLESKLHNPKAKIGYDIFAYRGGAMLYSQFAWLLNNICEADGPPTKAQRELADDLAKQLVGLIGTFDGQVKNDLVKLNDAAKKLRVPELYVPAPPKK